MIYKDQRGFAHSLILLIILVLAGVGGAGYLVYKKQNDKKQPDQKTTSINSFEDCVAAGNPVMESYPEQCSVNGKTYVNEAQLNDPANQPDSESSEKNSGNGYVSPLNEFEKKGVAINYMTKEDDAGIVIQKKSDTSKLKGASEEFKTYIASKVPANPKTLDCGGGDKIVEALHVRKIYKDGSASGGYISCSGAPIIWEKTTEGWKTTSAQ